MSLLAIVASIAQQQALERHRAAQFEALHQARTSDELAAWAAGVYSTERVSGVSTLQMGMPSRPRSKTCKGCGAPVTHFTCGYCLITND